MDGAWERSESKSSAVRAAEAADGPRGRDRRLFRDWQRDGEGGSLAGLGPHVDEAAVLRHDALRDRETEAGALLLGGEERDEEVLHVLAGDAGAGVGEAHLD